MEIVLLVFGFTVPEKVLHGEEKRRNGWDRGASDPLEGAGIFYLRDRLHVSVPALEMSASSDLYSSIWCPLPDGGNLEREDGRFEVRDPCSSSNLAGQDQSSDPSRTGSTLKEGQSQTFWDFPRRTGCTYGYSGMVDTPGDGIVAPLYPIMSEEVSILLHKFCSGMTSEGISDIIPEVPFLLQWVFGGKPFYRSSGRRGSCCVFY